MLNDLEKAIIVVAHPDDEILWFSSILKRVGHILFCFSDELMDPDFGARRSKFIAEFPMANTSTIGLTSVGKWRPRSFASPRLNPYGLEIVGDDPLVPTHRRKYEENYHAIRGRLAPLLSNYRHVFTHNPWGEYGHEEHVQVHRAICDLQAQADYDIWYSGYCSNRTVGMIDQTACIGRRFSLPPDHQTAGTFMQMYKQADLWTWQNDWTWPDWETFFKREEATPLEAGKDMLASLNLIRLKPVRPWNTEPAMGRWNRLISRFKKAIKRTAGLQGRFNG